jgi:PleD family two-component response regulator
MLAATGEADAMRVANAVCLSLAGLGLSNPRSPVAPTVTVSIGVATVVRGYFVDVAAFFAAADRALYTAKHLGRNRVVFFSQTAKPEERQELRDPGCDRDPQLAGRAGGAEVRTT